VFKDSTHKYRTVGTQKARPSVLVGDANDL